MNSDRWFFALFQQQPDLVTTFLPQGARCAGYRFEALELKAVSHRLDGVCWPPGGEQGRAEQPVVLLEVQMQRDPMFHHRLAAQSFRFLQQHPQVEHWQVVVIVPHRRLQLGPTTALASFLGEVIWVDLSALLKRSDLDPLDLNPLEELLSLVVRPKHDLLNSSRRLMQRSPQLSTAVATIVLGRLPNFSLEEIMSQLGYPLEYLSHSRGYQELKALIRKEIQQEDLEAGRKEGRQQEGAALALRMIARRCGPISPATDTTIRALPIERLELLADALLDFRNADDLADWLEQHG